MLKVTLIPCLTDNYSYLLESDGVLAVVDPSEEAPVLKALAGRRLDMALATHHHRDHIGAIPALKERFNCHVVAAKADRHRIPVVDRWVSEGDCVLVGSAEAVVWDIPGHTTGHISYYFAKSADFFCGDTLFTLGCGRLFEGTSTQMWQSLSRIRELPGETRIYCGHEYTLENGAYAVLAEPNNLALQKYIKRAQGLRAQALPTVPSLLKDELAANPFLRPESAEIQKRIGVSGHDFVKIFAETRADKDRWDAGR